MEHQFNIEIARELGIEEAILINNLAFWIAKNRADKKHYYKGRYWTYNSSRGLAELFPYMSERKIARVINNLIEKGIIIKDNFNENKCDRTQWYAFVKNDECIRQKCQMHSPKMSNAFTENVKCTIYTDNKPTDNKDIYTKDYICAIFENDENYTVQSEVDDEYGCINFDTLDTVFSTEDNCQKKLRKKKGSTHKPTIEEVVKYCAERGNKINPQQWFDYYEANGWKVGRNSMKDWKAAIRTWETKIKTQPYAEIRRNYTSSYTPAENDKRAAKEQRDAEFAAHIAAKLHGSKN